jgi:hypothetical protein
VTKTRETWDDEIVSTWKLNQIISDYINPGITILESIGEVNDATVPLNNPWYHQPYPYNGAKSIFNRMRVIFARRQSGGTGMWPEYTLDTGASWTRVDSGESPPYPLEVPSAIPGGVINRMRTIDISSILLGVYIGWRWNDDGGAPLQFSWTIGAFLYNAADDPF